MELKDMQRFDYANNHNIYIGLSSEIPHGYSDLPTEGVCNGSIFFVIDTKKSAMFYKGTWHEI